MRETKGGLLSCHNICWIVGALLGLVAAILIMNAWGLIVGILLAIALALVLQRLFCTPSAAQAHAHAHGHAAPAPAAPEPAAKPAAEPAPKAQAEAAGEPAAKPVAADGKPELFAAPQGGKADDLKMIKGVGPKLEALLNSLGVWHFEQIAGWRPAEIAWVDANLEGFRGRVERDDWVAQAKTLARGGATEFSKRAAKTGMYDDK